jgi:hypothetical protein
MFVPDIGDGEGALSGSLAYSVVLSPELVIKDSLARVTDRITKLDCAALFLADGENNAPNRVALSYYVDALGSNGQIKPMINTPALPIDVIGFTRSPFNPAFAEDETGIFLISGRGFFTGTLPNGKSLNTLSEFRGLNDSHIQEAILIHELLHYLGVVGRDAGKDPPFWQLPNGMVVSGVDKFL